MNDHLRQKKLFNEGFKLFNQKEFFACHEILEELWKEEREPERQFTQGIIQIAVGYHHLLRNNKEGAIKLLRKGSARLIAFEPCYANLKVSKLLSAVENTSSLLDNVEDARFSVPVLEFVSDSQ